MTNSSATRALLLAAIAAAALLEGCATRRGRPQELVSVSLTADQTGPRAAGSAIRWDAAVRGGVGALAYEFRYRRNGEQAVGQASTSSWWIWRPHEPGSYSMSVVVRDSLGYETTSGWSDPFEIAPALLVSTPAPSKTSPRRAKATDVFWTVDASGGVGASSFEFRLDDGELQRTVQFGPSSFWMWSPQRPGPYRVQAIVRDAAGYVVTTEWSEPFEVVTSLDPLTTIVVLPFENLSGGDVPLQEVRASMLRATGRAGIRVLEEDVLEGFMARHRMRWVGGLSSNLGLVFEEETGVEAVLVTSVEQYVESDPPKVALVSRLISTGEKAAILWMDGASLAGHQSPGGFDLKRIHTIDVLLERVTGELTDSLADFVSNESRGLPWSPPRIKKTRRFGPQGFYRSPDATFGGNGPIRVAVLPFENETGHLDAGRIMALHFVRCLVGRPDLYVIEPGEVRRALLRSRLILDEGPSLPQAELLRTLVDVDLIIAGTVTDYEDPQGLWGAPVVGFGVQGIDSESKRVGWTSIGHARGDAGVFFFDVGRVDTAYELASRMVGQVVARGMNDK